MKRITSIDSLRAFALLGILIIHARQGFGVGGVEYVNTIDIVCGGGVKLLFENRFALIFNILFGVSFYIILGKKDYPASKFVWRCFLLAMLGLLNRLFFNNDVLFKYGICGMLLVFIRNLSNKRIYVLIGVLMVLGLWLKGLDFGNRINLTTRYIRDISMLQFFKSYPLSLLMLVKQFLNGDFILIYANMAIGYVLGRIGFVESMDKCIESRHVFLSLTIYAVLGMICYGSPYVGFRMNHFIRVFTLNLFWYSGAAFYWLFFIWLYNHVKWFHKLSSLFEAYGKCGLTNYSMQGFLGILIFYYAGIGYWGLSYSVVLSGSIVFFIIQALFCAVWLSYFKNGPLEYLWRCATERKWLPLVKR